MEKMSIHRALAELKLLDSRISNKSTNEFISYKKNSAKKINGKEVNTVIEDIKSNYQSVKDLISRRAKIKTAVIQSNAETFVEIAGEKMTVAYAIDRKNSITYDKNLLFYMKDQYSKAVSYSNLENEKADKNAVEFVNNLYKDKSQVDPNKIKDLINEIKFKDSVELINPLNLEEEIKKLEKEVEDFEMEVDFKLSESNAQTFIEI